MSIYTVDSANEIPGLGTHRESGHMGLEHESSSERDSDKSGDVPTKLGPERPSARLVGGSR